MRMNVRLKGVRITRYVNVQSEPRDKITLPNRETLLLREIHEEGPNSLSTHLFEGLKSGIIVKELYPIPDKETNLLWRS
ncbi:hypothetical protein [Thermococcus sp.]|uniref:hypothetical protein n=1 Tax=Thermococcus sp. TaxID=35749 RepID=UPI00260739B0|nr:hypothetical protein [Thermococcus sp.]